MDDGDIEDLRRENRKLKGRLEELEDERRRERERQRWVLKRGGSLLVPLIDRQRVIRNFVGLVRACSGFAGPRDAWPKREDLSAAGEAFAVSLLRLFIRRRLFFLVISLAALAMPVMQVWLLLQQNRLIGLQNELIGIQADDIVARGVTQDNLVANQINGALLSGRDFPDLSQMLRRVFGAQMGEAVGATMEAPEVRGHYLQNTAARAHLLLALAEAIQSPGGERRTPAQIWRMLVDPRHGGALPEVLRDAETRTLVAVRSSKAAFDGALVELECQRYILGLSMVLRRSFSLAVTMDERDTFFRMAAPLFARVSTMEGEGGPLAPVFAQSFRELLVDLALEPRYGEPEPAVPKNVDAVLAKGFAGLQDGVGNQARVRWPRLKALLGVK